MKKGPAPMMSVSNLKSSRDVSQKLLPISQRTKAMH
nr:MAG TPA: hypothetical protein [Caudoviricetes sp.]